MLWVATSNFRLEKLTQALHQTMQQKLHQLLLSNVQLATARVELVPSRWTAI